jgi:cell division control protein 6
MARIELRLQPLRGYLVIFIDEADNVRTDFNTFYQFLVKRLPLHITARLILVFASNRLNWSDNLDPRVKSCLKAREILFGSYNAENLARILEIRIEKALRRDRIDEGVVAKIAALASRQHGDARKAVNLLTRSTYLAEKLGSSITLNIVDQAYEEIERDRYVDMIRTSPKHLQAALHAAITGKSKSCALHTGDAYIAYQRFCDDAGLQPVTQRAFTDLLAELDMYGFITARTVSRGRYGRSREIRVSLQPDVAKRLITVIRETFDLTIGVTSP